METGIYVRVSTEEQAQEGFSIRGQEQKLKDYARVKDWQIYKLYADEGISGKDINGRPALIDLLADVKAQRVKNVLVFKIDRLTRSTADLIYLVDLFNECDCAFNSLMESIDTHTPSGRMFLKIIGIFAEFERENIIERVRLGVGRKVKEGYSLCTSFSSFGYDRPKHQKLQTINGEQANIVTEIFAAYVLEGLTLTAIARRLNTRDVRTKTGVTWNSSKIRRVLTNENYIGSVRHHIWDSSKKATFEGKHDAIVDIETFSRAQALLASNQRVTPTKQPRTDKYFAGFLVCAKCGYKMKTYNVRQKTAKGTKAYGGYVCANRTLKTCDGCNISHAKVEAAFEAYIKRIADFEPPEDDMKEQHDEAIRIAANQIAALEAKLKALEAKEKETLSLYVSNALSFEEYREMRSMIARDCESVNNELERLSSAQQTAAPNDTEITLNLHDNWSLFTYEERRSFLRAFVKRITVDSDKPIGARFVSVNITNVEFQSIP